jgi:hypothetical protein
MTWDHSSTGLLRTGKVRRGRATRIPRRRPGAAGNGRDRPAPNRPPASEGLVRSRGRRRLQAAVASTVGPRGRRRPSTPDGGRQQRQVLESNQVSRNTSAGRQPLAERLMTRGQLETNSSARDGKLACAVGEPGGSTANSPNASPPHRARLNGRRNRDFRDTLPQVRGYGLLPRPRFRMRLE